MKRKIKLKSLIKSKRGFTLVELVVATAILGLVTITVMGMMSTGSNMFNNVHKRTLTLFKSQVASIQLRDVISNCSSCIAVDGNDLFIIDKQSNSTGTISKYEFDPNTKTIFFKQTIVEITGKVIQKPDLPINNAIYSEDSGNFAPFCYDVLNIEYKINPANVSDSNHISALRFDITTNKLGLSTTKTETISLRSTPLFISNDEGKDNFEEIIINEVWGLNNE